MSKNDFLIGGGIFSFLIALLHVFVIFGGPDWYRFFGAGEEMAQLAEQGAAYPIVLTLAITLLFVVWGLYAFSAAGLVRKMSYTKPALVIISSVYTFRGLMAIPIVFFIKEAYLDELKESLTFMVVTSFVSLIIGLVHVVGTVKYWRTLRTAPEH